MPELQTAPVQAQETEATSSGHGSAATMPWNQQGLANLWGLATAKAPLEYWLKQKSFSVFVLTRFIFAAFFVTVTLNGFVVFNRVLYGGKGELASYPAATALVLLLVLASTKERSQGIYFWVGWSFLIFYNLVGFVNATSLTSENFRGVIMVVVKNWINLIGVPWMAFRVISPDKLPRYTKLLVLTSAVGSIMCLVQTANPALFSYIRGAETLRGAGTWGNSNGAALVLMLALFLTRLVSWRSRWMKWLVYIILLAGFIGTFSRGALVAFVLGEIVYLVIVGNYKRIFFGGSFLLLFLGSWIAMGFLVKNNTIHVESKEIRYRVESIANLFTGKGGKDLESNRLGLWRAGIQDVLNDGSLLFGLGHLGGQRTSAGLAPHNEYVQYFGEAGLLGLFALLGLLSTFAYIFWRCKDRTIRASLMSMIAGYSTFCMTGDNLFSLQTLGPYFAIFVMWAHYLRDYPGAEKIRRLKTTLSRSLAASKPTAVGSL